jgi:hypothetical protein
MSELLVVVTSVVTFDAPLVSAATISTKAGYNQLRNVCFSKVEE